MAIKLIFLAYRRPEMSPEEFQDYWVNQHAPFVRSVKDQARILKYVQSYTLDTDLNRTFAEARGIPVDTPPDGVAEAWWESEDDINEAFSGADGEAVAQSLVDDEGKFCDFSRSRAFWTAEREII
ncbi:EthD domain-containing protein [Ornithinimicrobium faecis]|uniref:EthD domain-containing protein n=1 Tax=Ornithinimicrobium faecis TaxID=2934158 RepID=UPI002119648E|nr:EthD domain-containing protein [Ornithinimicrobium sp. HY1745]